MAIPNYCATVMGGGFPNLLNTSSTNWAGLTFIGLLGTFSLMAVGYMLAQLLRLPKLEAWVKFEMFQVLATALLAILVVGWLWGMCSWNVAALDTRYAGDSPDAQKVRAFCNDLAFIKSGDSGYTSVNPIDNQGRPMVTPFCAAQYYLSRVESRGRDIFQVLMVVNYGITYLFRTTWESRPMGIGYTIEPLAGLQQLQNLFLVGVSGFMVSYLTILVQQRLLEFYLLATPFFLLPLGLLLRSVSPTRTFGGALLGFAIASLFFYPLLLVVNDIVVYGSLDILTAPAERLRSQLLPAPQAPVPFEPPAGVTNLTSLGRGDKVRLSGAEAGLARVYWQLDDHVTIETLAGDIYDVRKLPAGGFEAQPLQRPFNWHTAGQGYQDSVGPYENKPDSSGDPVFREQTDWRRLFSQMDPGTAQLAASGQLRSMGIFILWPFQMVMIYMVAAVVLPVVNFLIYIEVARQLTRLFGEQLDVSNLTRLI